jgi:uncharacterized protein YndB with AHSA1/START domain
MKWFLVALGILSGCAALIVLIGALLPRAHVASRTLRVRRAPAEVWALITDVAAFPTWRTGVTHVEQLPDRNGRPAWIEHLSTGPIPLETIDAEPPHRLIVRIADDKLPFGGTWTYVVAPADAGAASTLTITEDGFVSNVIFRFMSRLVFGHHATIDVYLKNVAAKFGEKAELTGN